MNASANAYKFSEFTLNPTKRTLFRESAETKLRDKDFEVLLFLIESAPKPCSHNEIIAVVWNGIAVENNSVDKALTNIRKVLNEDKASPRFVKNVRGKGFLFIGDVEKVYEVSSNQNRSDNQSTEIELSHLLNNRPNWRKVSLVLTIFVLIGFVGVLWKTSGYIWTRLTQKIIFADDFSSNEINPTLWQIRGKTVVVEDGIAKILWNGTDNGGRIDSVLFPFDRNKPVIIKTRQKVSYSQNLKDTVYFIGKFGITPKTPLFDQIEIHNKYIFGVQYTNTDYESKYPNGDFDFIKAEGFFLFNYCGAPYKKADYRDGKISGRIKPVWHEWFEQKIIYNPSNGEVSFFINNQLKETFNAGDLLKEMDEDKLKVEISPDGWWINHSIELDYIEITQ